jgi:hypothetical protein
MPTLSPTSSCQVGLQGQEVCNIERFKAQLVAKRFNQREALCYRIVAEGCIMSTKWRVGAQRQSVSMMKYNKKYLLY